MQHELDLSVGERAAAVASVGDERELTSLLLLIGFVAHENATIDRIVVAGLWLGLAQIPRGSIVAHSFEYLAAVGVRVEGGGRGELALEHDDDLFADAGVRGGRLRHRYGTHLPLELDMTRVVVQANGLTHPFTTAVARFRIAENLMQFGEQVARRRELRADQRQTRRHSLGRSENIGARGLELRLAVVARLAVVVAERLRQLAAHAALQIVDLCERATRRVECQPQEAVLKHICRRLW